MQTSFMHPPFGFALFYLRSVAPAKDYVDRVDRQAHAGVTTGQIYWGAVPFVMIQVIMVALVIAFPRLVTGNLDKAPDASKIEFQVPKTDYDQPDENAPPTGEQAPGDAKAGADSSGKSAADKEAEDILKDLKQR